MSRVGFMMDVETLGVGVKAPIFEVGIVAFDLDTMDQIDAYLWHVDVVMQILRGSVVEPDTVDWWRKQKTQPSRSIIQNPDEAAWSIASIFDKHQPREVWANSPSFDCVLLREMFGRTKVVCPWSFRVERDFRTILKIASEMGFDVDVTEVTHSAVRDAEQQLETLRGALAWVRGARVAGVPGNG